MVWIQDPDPNCNLAAVLACFLSGKWSKALAMIPAMANEVEGSGPMTSGYGFEWSGPYLKGRKEVCDPTMIQGNGNGEMKILIMKGP